MISWVSITGLADSNFLLPLAALLAAWLAGARAWESAIQWCLLFGAGLFIVAATKIAYIGWGIGISSIDFTGFSGHAMRAMAIAPLLIYILLQKQTDRIQRIGLLIGIGFGIVIGISRLEVHAHSVSEVVGGWVLGAIVSFSLIRLCRHRPPISFDRRLLVVGLIALLPTLAAKPAPTERWIEDFAHYLSGNDKAVMRH